MVLTTPTTSSKLSPVVFPRQQQWVQALRSRSSLRSCKLYRSILSYPYFKSIYVHTIRERVAMKMYFRHNQFRNAKYSSSAGFQVSVKESSATAVEHLEVCISGLIYPFQSYTMDATERIQAASSFLLQSPPGEINDVLNGSFFRLHDAFYPSNGTQISAT